MEDTRPLIPLFSRAIRRAPHFRGHGIHSPFAYRLARDVLRGKPGGEYGIIYDTLKSGGVRDKDAAQLQRLTVELELSRLFINEYAPLPGSLYLFFSPYQSENLLYLIGALHNSASVVCVVKRKSRKTFKPLRKMILSRHDGLTIEKRGYMLIFFEKGVSRQHIKL